MSDRASISRDNLGFLLAKASQCWNELLSELLSQAGFPEVRPAFGSVLVPLAEEDDLRMGELATRARLSKQAMTTLVRSVEEAGLVLRVRDPEDGRAARVRLTRRGREFRPVAEQVLRELGDLMAERLEEDELDRLVNALRKVVES
jgi:MarR family transcriptional regulator for hemolysin